MKIYKDEQELMNTDWMSKINEAVDAENFELAAQYEQARNDKINNPLYTGKQTTTNRYAQYLAPDTEPSAPAAVVGGSSGSAGTKISYPSFDAAAWEAKKPTYVSDYADRIDALWNDVMNREAFSYDADSDPLYQQYQKQYRREGTRAMEDTLAELASGAGGMNSYAVTAAQQANNYYGAQLADRIPELYQLAYEMYMQDYEQDLSDLELLRGLEADAYGRYQDELADWYEQYDLAADSNQTAYDRALELALLKADGYTDEQLADAIALAAPPGMAQTPVVQTPAAQDDERKQEDKPKPPKGAYDNGSLSEDQIRELQNFYEVDADGKWGKNSTAAAGGQTAEQAWQEYARMMGYTEKNDDPYYTGSKKNVDYDEETGEFIWANKVYDDFNSFRQAVENTDMTADEAAELVRRLKAMGFYGETY